MAIKFATERLKEPSTWGALAGLAAIFGATIAPEHLQTAMQIIAAISYGAGVVLPEKSQSAPGS